MRPELSPDGRWLAYATRNNAETSLMLARSLKQAMSVLLLPKIQRDDQESRPNRDVIPTFAFTPDSQVDHHCASRSLLERGRPTEMRR